MLRPALLLSIACVSLCAGCAVFGQRPLREKIGGELRTRRHANPAAYEAFLRAELAAAQHDFREADTLYEHASQLDPLDPQLVARRVEVLLENNQSQRALTLALQATRDFAQQSTAWLSLARVRMATHDTAGAREAAARAQVLSPLDPDVVAAVVRVAGGNDEDVVRAVRALSTSRQSDRNVAEIASVMHAETQVPLGVDWRVLRRLRAQRAFEAGLYAQADAWLTPLVRTDGMGENREDRLLLIEARIRDGRGDQAAALIAGLGESEQTTQSTVDLASLWLRAGDAQRAEEMTRDVLVSAPLDGRAKLVRAQSWVALGRASDALQVLSSIESTSTYFVQARVLAVRTVQQLGNADLAKRLTQTSIAQLDVGDAPGRDRLRLEAASHAQSVEEETQWLRAMETPWGRQQRGLLRALRTVDAAVLDDLLVRTGEPDQDARADAQLAMVCGLHATSCTGRDAGGALTRATATHEGYAETRRAKAVTLARTSLESAWAELEVAMAMEPESPWNVVVARWIAGASP